MEEESKARRLVKGRLNGSQDWVINEFRSSFVVHLYQRFELLDSMVDFEVTTIEMPTTIEKSTRV